MSPIHPRPPTPVRNRALNGLMLMAWVGVFAAIYPATRAADITFVASPDVVNTDKPCTTMPAPTTYGFSGTPSPTSWSFYGDQRCSLGFPAAVKNKKVEPQHFYGDIDVATGVVDIFETVFDGTLTPTGTATGQLITKPWCVYAWDHTIKITNSPVYISVKENGLTREELIYSATLNSLGPETRVEEPTWSADLPSGLSFSSTKAWAITVTNTGVATGRLVTFTVHANARPFDDYPVYTKPPDPPTVNAKLAIMDVNIFSTAFTETNEESTGVLVPVLETTATSGGVAVSLSIAPTDSVVTGEFKLEASSAGKFAVYSDAALSTALISSTQTTATFASATSIPSTVYLKGITVGTSDTLSLVFTPSAQTGGSTPPEFMDKITVRKMDIVAPAENDVLLKGEEIKFDGEVDSAGLSGIAYAWSVLEGTCDPATAATEDFETTLMSSGTIKVKLIVTVGGATCEKIRTIEAVVPEVTKLSWKNDHALLQGATGSSAITDPVWTKTLGGAVTKNEPGAYTKDGYATAGLEIEGASPLTHSASVQVKGDGNTENFYPTGATFHDWTWRADELQLDSSPLYGSVNFYDTLDVTWYYRVEKLAGGWGDWIEMNQSQHLLYTTLATPTIPEATPHAVIIDYACRWAANETAGDGVCSSMLNNGFKAHYTWGYDCHRLSSDFIRLIATLGISGSQHNWASNGNMFSGNAGWMCYQRTKSFTPVGGTAGVREWSWHQWAEAAGSQRDPSAAASKSGSWGGYEDDLFTHYYECTTSSPFNAQWVSNQSGQTSGCEAYPANCSYNSSPSVYFWRGPDR